ncbi:MAG TPA: hypothetical protein VGK73_22410 [Polyangiaceae bacterium]
MHRFVREAGLLGVMLAALAATSCGPPPPAEPPAPEGPPEPEPASAPPAASASAASTGAPAEAETAPEAPAAPAPNPEAPRDVRYVQSQDGLKVEVLGVRFFTSVKPVRTQAGFDVKVLVSATASEARSLLSPENGPLAFAGTIKRAGKSEPERFGDERKGDGEQPLGADTTVKLSREWPGKSGVRPLGNGDVLELDVGLWGLGHDASDRRAVKQFARVRMKVDKWQASARIEPPPTVTGK